jgi:hypothetical protein
VPAGDIDIALDGERNAVKGAEVVAALGRGLGVKRLPARSVAIEVRERVEPAVAFGDAVEGMPAVRREMVE